MLRELEEKILSDKEITRDEALAVASIPEGDVFELFSAANRIRRRFRGDYVDICSIINAKSGACPENCAYCAQSSRSGAAAETFPLVEKDLVLERARAAREGGARRFCIVTSGRRVSPQEISTIAEMVKGVRELGLRPCATLGLLSADELMFLRDSGLERFHHNLETSEGYFPRICTTHTYAQKMKTIEGVISSGLSLCSGGIFGLGESWEDRVDMAIALRGIGPDSVPINFLMPIAGTKLGSRQPLHPLEALKVVSLYRFMLPEKEIRICGGRMQTLGEFHSFIFFAGADGLLSGNYLTRPGRGFEDDRRLIELYGLRYR